MTRKRYIKLLMACGYSRNTAVKHARLLQKWHGSYRDSAENLERMFCDVARNGAEPIWRLAGLYGARILHRALYGEVAHE